MLCNANVYGTQVEKHTTPAAVLDCIALSLMTVADHKVPDTIGKRESTEKVDVVCERGCSGGYTAGRRFTMAVSPRKDSGSDDARSSTPDRDSETKSLPPSPGMSPLPTQPTTPKSIKVRVHCPTLFHRIARAFGTSIADIAGSLQACALLDHVNEGPVCSELASPGKGGSRFYFFGGTALKSLTEAEGNSLKALLPGFLQHVTENPETLLPRYTSWVTVSYRNSMNSKVTERYALFNNIVVSPRVVPQLYDIKGSTFLRDGGSTMTSAVSPGETVTVLKDNELKSRIASHPEADKVLNTLAADVGFLEMNKLVDYSLLFGVRPVAPLSEAVGRAENGILSTNGDEVYYLGLIDILQSYTCSKALETCFKGVIASEDDISVIPPTAYATRFIRSASRLLGFDLS